MLTHEQLMGEMLAAVKKTQQEVRDSLERTKINNITEELWPPGLYKVLLRDYSPRLIRLHEPASREDIGSYLGSKFKDIIKVEEDEF